MKFCRSCGATLQQTTPGSPALVPAVGAPMVPPPAMPPPGVMGAGFAAPAPSGPNATSPPRAPVGSTITCPRCATATPVGFAYCQQCGLHLNAIAPTDPGAYAPPRIRPQTGAPPMGVQGNAAGIDPQGATLAADGVRAGSMLPPSARPSSPSTSPSGPGVRLSASGATWGSAVLVNRDGTDGQRFGLTSEDTIVGRAGADIAFDDDRFLARQHARISRRSDGSVNVHPIDTTNGVFKKTDGSVELADGAIILVGREVLRFERVTTEERTVHPLVRHGVALFGSPPRDPWARIVQLIPSGGYRDVRHLVGDEVVLGREEGEIVFRDDAFMSRRHAAITWDGKRALLTDLGSSNGTFVRLTGPTSIKHGDHVRMGDQLMRIEH
jgi:pSer/pThr/pTyr-binding forkhead associated (FHA) protein